MAGQNIESKVNKIIRIRMMIRKYSRGPRLFPALEAIQTSSIIGKSIIIFKYNPENLRLSIAWFT
jgi:hypothetical protein